MVAEERMHARPYRINLRDEPTRFLFHMCAASIPEMHSGGEGRAVRPQCFSDRQEVHQTNAFRKTFRDNWPVRMASANIDSEAQFLCMRRVLGHGKLMVSYRRQIYWNSRRPAAPRSNLHVQCRWGKSFAHCFASISEVVHCMGWWDITLQPSLQPQGRSKVAVEAPSRESMIHARGKLSQEMQRVRCNFAFLR